MFCFGKLGEGCVSFSLDFCQCAANLCCLVGLVSIHVSVRLGITVPLGTVIFVIRSLYFVFGFFVRFNFIVFFIFKVGLNVRVVPLVFIGFFPGAFDTCAGIDAKLVL